MIQDFWKKHSNTLFLIGILFSLMLMIKIFLEGPLWERTWVYEAPPTSQQIEDLPFRFVDVAPQLGVEFQHVAVLPFSKEIPQDEKMDRGRALGGVMPSVAVADYNGDGFVDILVTEPAGPFPVRLFENQKGASFKEVTHSSGLADIRLHGTASLAVWMDYNHDGALDIFVASWGCHGLLKNTNGTFSQEENFASALPCHGTNAVGLADIDLDGNLDIILGNYAPKGLFRHPERVQGAGDKQNGEENKILFMSRDGSHREESFFPQSKAYTMAVGLSDINQDGFPDLLFTNDYSSDELYINLEGKRFKDRTEHYIPSVQHGYAGMNAEFADVDDDGDLDLYVSNVFKPPFMITGNLLWLREGERFRNQANELGTRRCGWSWSAKIADFDNDRSKEILVVNGRYKPKGVRSPAQSSSYWFQRMNERSTPKFLRSKLIEQRSADFSKTDFSGWERNCFFWKQGEKYIDVAPASGLGEEQVTKAMALLDFDNDGRLDIVQIQYDGPLHLFQNQSSTSNSWIGFDLRRNSSEKFLEGVRVELIENKNKRIAELFPTNGFRGQSDRRIHFGFGEKPALPLEAVVHWANSPSEKFEIETFNQYVVLQEGTGHVEPN